MSAQLLQRFMRVATLTALDATMQALDSIMFVIRNFQRTFATRLGDITSKALEHDSSSEYDQLVVASRITTQLAKDRHCLEDTRTLTSIRHKLLGSPGLMFHLEHAAKSALESELLFKALKVLTPSNACL